MPGAFLVRGAPYTLCWCSAHVGLAHFAFEKSGDEKMLAQIKGKITVLSGACIQWGLLRVPLGLQSNGQDS